jgi:hypothetical protein
VTEGVRLLSPATNYAVVQLPGRAFPGVVFQGDSLDNLIAELEEALSDSEGLTDVVERLKGVRRHYEAVCRKEGVGLPYSPGL